MQRAWAVNLKSKGHSTLLFFFSLFIFFFPSSSFSSSDLNCAQKNNILRGSIASNEGSRLESFRKRSKQQMNKQKQRTPDSNLVSLFCSLSLFLEWGRLNKQEKIPTHNTHTHGDALAHIIETLSLCWWLAAVILWGRLVLSLVPWAPENP